LQPKALSFPFNRPEGPLMAAASAADKRLLLSELAGSRRRGNSHPSGGSFRGRALAAGFGAVLILFLIWLAGSFSAPRPVRDVRALVDEQVAHLGRVSRNEAPLSEVSFAPVFERMRDVPAAYREQVRGDLGRLFAAREAAEINSFFALPPAERQAELDRRIRASEQRRQAREASRNAGTGGREAGATASNDTSSNGTSSNGPAAGGGARGGTAQTGGGSPSRPRRGSSTEEERNMRRKASIDRSTPEQRARRAEYRRVMQERREQLAGAGGRR
jgi:hypothetical protein